MNLEELGITRDELTERLVAKLTNELLSERYAGYDEDGDPIGGERPTDSARQLHQLVRERIDRQVAALAEKHVLPKVDSMIANLVLQQTNAWGEKTGKAVTFIEYMVQRGEAYLAETVDWHGKSRQEDSGYNWKGHQTRLTHMVHKYLHHEVEQAMKKSTQTVMDAFAKDMTKTVKLKLQEISDQLKVAVTTR